MKKYIYPMALAATLLTTTGCSDDEVNDAPVIPDDQKEMISFSLSDGTSTRAGFTGADTRIVCRIQSDADGKFSLYTRTVLKAEKDNTGGATDYSKVNYYTADNTRYWDDAYGRAAKLSVYAVAIPNSTSDSKLSDSKLSGGSTWAKESSPNNSIKWDVTYGTQTSTTLAAEDLVYSNNIQNGGINGRYVWDFTTNPEGYPADNGRLDGHSDGQLQFTQKGGALESDAGHFDKGHLMFNHSLSRLTITLVEGDGFDKTSASKDNDFKFTNSANIKLLQMPYTGTLDVKAGAWSSISTKDIDKLISSSSTANKADETFSAQVLPSYKFYENGAANVMQFVIDNNTYYVPQSLIYTALNTTDNTTANKVAVETDDNGNYIEMKQGKNYTLSITVNKTEIKNVTATLAPWVEVAGSFSINNAHITLSLNTSGTTCDKDIDLYRLDDDNAGYDADNYDFSYKGKNWFGNYLTDEKHKTTLEHSALADNKWTTPWFFESNKTYYHFRTVNKGTTIKGNSDSTNDYFEISAGSTDATDPHWGAPMQITTTTWLKYDTEKGYEAHLHHAIGATEDQIAIQELHMMSKINVVLETPNDGGKVTLYDDTTDPSNPVGTIVKITRLAKNGTVEMGRGLVTPSAPTGTGDDTYAKAEVTMTPPATTSASDYFTTTGVTNRTQSKNYSFAVVPQSLSRDFSSESDDDYVGIFIQTPDNNQYYIVKRLSEIYATSVSDTRDQAQYNESGTDAEKEASKIKRWFPGHSYTYTFTISKTGIQNVTATVADWVTVVGQNQDLNLED